MFLKDHITRTENIKAIQALNQAQIDHDVIALFMTREGITMQAQDVRSILNSHEQLGSRRLASKKVQALLAAKKVQADDAGLPCPASY